MSKTPRPPSRPATLLATLLFFTLSAGMNAYGQAKKLVLSVSEMQFSIANESERPVPQLVSVASNGDPVSYDASVGYVSTMTGWLSVTSQGGMTPSALAVKVDAHGLAKGLYMGFVKVTSGVDAVEAVTVTLKVGDFGERSVQGGVLTESLPRTLRPGFTPPLASSAPSSNASSVSTLSAPASPVSRSLPRTNASGDSATRSTPRPRGMDVAVPTVTITGQASTSGLAVTPTSIVFPNTPWGGGYVLSSTPLAVTSTPTGAGYHMDYISGAGIFAMSPQDGNAPQSVSVYAYTSPPVITVNTLYSAVWAMVDDSGVVVQNISLQITLTPPGGGGGGGGTISTNTGTLSFAQTIPGSAPPSQTITVNSSVASATNFTVSHLSSATWLTISPLSGSATLTNPATLTVSVDGSALAPSSTAYTDTIQIISPNNTATVTVSLTVTAVSITVTPASLTFNEVLTGSPTDSQTLKIAGTGGAISFSATASTNPASSWLSVSPISGTVSSTSSTNLTVTVNITGLSAGSYSGQILVSTGATSIPVAVSMVLNAAGVLTSSPPSLTFTQTVGGTAPGSQTLQITGSAGATNFTVGTLPSWITVTPTNATTPATLTVSVNPNGLATGTNSGSIQLISGVNSITVPVSFIISGSSTALAATPTSLTFSQTVGGPAPTAQTVSVTSSNGTVGFTVSSTGTWLNVSAASGATPTTVSIGVNTSASSLAPGTYTGTVTLTAGSNSATVGVTLNVVSAAFSVAPGSLTFSSAAGAAAPPPQTLQVTSTLSNVSFTASVSAAASSWLSILSSSSTAPAILTVSVTPAGLVAGQYSGAITVTPTGGTLSSQIINVSLTLSATSGGTPPNVLSILNGASFLPGPLAPGEIISIFGTGLGPNTGVSTTVLASGGVSSALAGTQVLFDGIPAPLLYVQSNQINAVVPYEMYGRASAGVVILVTGGAQSPQLNLQIANTAPAVFSVDGSGTGQGAVINQDSTVNSAYYPAPRGSWIEIFATGDGQTASSTGQGGQDGRIISSDLRYPLAPVSVTIGLVPAKVIYAGSAPGLVSGALQINVFVPAGAPVGGGIPVVVQIGGNASPPTVTIAVK